MRPARRDGPLVDPACRAREGYGRRRPRGGAQAVLSRERAAPQGVAPEAVRERARPSRHDAPHRVRRLVERHPRARDRRALPGGGRGRRRPAARSAHPVRRLRGLAAGVAPRREVPRGVRILEGQARRAAPGPRDPDGPAAASRSRVAGNHRVPAARQGALRRPEVLRPSGGRDAVHALLHGIRRAALALDRTGRRPRELPGREPPARRDRRAHRAVREPAPPEGRRLRITDAARPRVAGPRARTRGIHLRRPAVRKAHRVAGDGAPAGSLRAARHVHLPERLHAARRAAERAHAHAAPFREPGLGVRDHGVRRRTGRRPAGPARVQPGSLRSADDRAVPEGLREPPPRARDDSGRPPRRRRRSRPRRAGPSPASGRRPRPCRSSSGPATTPSGSSSRSGKRRSEPRRSASRTTTSSSAATPCSRSAS